MKIILLVLPLCLSFMVSGTESLWFCDSADPCHAANSSTPFEPELRAENCQYQNVINPALCDRYITPGWYRFEQDMLNHPPMLLSCTAVYPSWLNGTLPTVEGEEVERTVCKVGFSDDCVRTVAIKIKHCGSFNAYCLPALDSCSERFCFGERDPSCDPSTTRAYVSTTHAVTQTPSPTKQPTTTHVTKTPEPTKQPTTTQFPAVTQTPKPTKQPHYKTTTQFPFVPRFCSSDPCSANDLPKILNPRDRSANCKYTSFMQSCDRDLPLGWYKAEGEYNRLLNTCPGALSCGAIHPVWMNGSHPTENDGLVRREICTVGIGGRKDCCLHRQNIFVKNCGAYTAYCLRPLNLCEERYCFGQYSPCSEYTDDADIPEIVVCGYRVKRPSHHYVVGIAIAAVLGVGLAAILVVMRRRIIRFCNKDKGHKYRINTCGCGPNLKKGFVPLGDNTVSAKISYA